MRKNISAILLITVLVLLICGCGGGGGTTPDDNAPLRGLEGSWTVNLSFTGVLTTPTGTENVSDSGTGTWTIGPNGIAAGFPLNWTYDGTTLVIHWITTANSTDPLCGLTTTTADVQLNIPISRDQTSANITGSGTMTRVTELCGTSSGNLVYQGTMVR